MLGLAEPVHPLPYLPRQCRLFGRRFRLRPHAAGAAYSLSAVRHARTPLWPCACAHRCGSKVRNDAERAANAAAWSGAVAQNSSRRARIAGRCAAIIPVGMVAFFRFCTGIIKGREPVKLIPALTTSAIKRTSLEGVLALRFLLPGSASERQNPRNLEQAVQPLVQAPKPFSGSAHARNEKA